MWRTARGDRADSERRDCDEDPGTSADAGNGRAILEPDAPAASSLQVFARGGLVCAPPWGEDFGWAAGNDEVDRPFFEDDAA